MSVHCRRTQVPEVCDDRELNIIKYPHPQSFLASRYRSIPEASKRECILNPPTFQTFDFTTLYTLIPHDKLKLQFNGLLTAIYNYAYNSHKYRAARYLQVSGRF